MTNSPGSKFTRKEAIILSGLTMEQVRKLDERDLIVPEKTPMRYRWSQIIMLRAFYYLRKDWTFKQLEKVLKKQVCQPIDMGIENYQAIVCNDESFQVYSFDDLSYKRSDRQLKFDDIAFQACFHKQIPGGVITSKPFTLIAIPYLIKELWEIGLKENIANFSIKAKTKPNYEDLERIAL